MNCPTCGRGLATGAQKCVYCAAGTKVRPREQLAVPEGTVPRKGGGFHLGRWGLIAIIAAVAAVVWFTPGLHAKIQPIIDKIKSMF